jgi:hypothetical protein
MSTTADETQRRRRCLIALIVTTAVFVLSLIPAGLFAMMSPMAFDSGASAQAWMIVLPIWLYPFAVLVSLAGSWIAFAARRYRFALIWSLLPLLDVAFIAAVFALLG